MFLQTAGPAGRLLGDADRGRRRAAPADDARGRRRPTRTTSREKVIVRSNGTVTYVGKDMAYQFWKFGLLGRGLPLPAVRPARRTDGRCGRPAGSRRPGRPAHPPFGGAGAVYNVIDVRQSYLQKLLKQALAAIGHPDEAERSIHFSYEMVALSHSTARQLGYTLVGGGRRRGRSSRCPGARASASRPTTCWTR